MGLLQSPAGGLQTHPYSAEQRAAAKRDPA